ncbi:AAA family ATPase [Clostridium sp. Ade.TY]|uniref:AAA family ATPase n=1 Tax=Clostridium sp. Ade.TY TaxID=1391647 RepID=UPI00040116D6|nr:AAA family ATPase [Clostridium sp. Ade.TY]
MAIFHGNLKGILPNLNDSSLNLIKKFKEELDNSFNIFLKHNVNGDDFNILIIREGAGILILDVLNWNLENYIYVTGGNAGKYGIIINKNNRNNKIPFITPFEKITRLKENIYKYHIEEFMKRSILNLNYINLIHTSIYFSGCKSYDITDKFSNNTREMKKIKLWGDNSKILNDIKFILKPNKLFDQELYNIALRNIKYKSYNNSNSKYLNLDKKKIELMKSKEGVNAKIKGIAGSGKTTLLCNRAISAYKRIHGNGRILILTYNITLRNYIKEKMSSFKIKFNWSAFYINSYYMFLNQRALELGVDIKNINNEGIYKLFSILVKEENKYDAIFIDEVQDFEREWLDLLKDVFLKENGEYILFGDEKQNIYNRELDTKKRVKTNVRGRWNELTTSYRISSNIAILLKEFQKEFFIKKYELDNIIIEEQIGLNINEDEITYIYCDNLFPLDIFEKGKFYLDEKKLNYKNTCIICANLEELREMEYYARNEYNIKVERMFETKEEFLEICKRENKIKILEDLRESRQFNFFVTSEGLKMCNIEKFTGLEIDNLIFVIDKNDKNMELIYTAISRCRKNLFIINRGNVKFDNFINSLNIK